MSKPAEVLSSVVWLTVSGEATSKNQPREQGPKWTPILRTTREQLGCVLVKSLQWCPTLWDPVDCSQQAPLSMGFSGQEYWMEWVAMPSSRGSSRPRDWTCIFYVSWIGKHALYH